MSQKFRAEDKYFVPHVGTADHLECNPQNCGIQEHVDIFPANGSFACLHQPNTAEMQTKLVSLFSFMEIYLKVSKLIHENCIHYTNHKILN